MSDENIVSEEDSYEELKKNLKKRLELELGLPLTPKLVKKIERDFNDTVILADNFPVKGISTLKIGDTILNDEDYVLDESSGIIYLNKKYAGLLYLEYIYCLDKCEYEPLLDLMVEYEQDTNIYRDASSISEKNVSISFDNNLNKGNRIQAMIEDLKNKYKCHVEMI